MFTNERSDYAVPIVGYLLVAAILIFEGISALYYGKILDNDADFHFLMYFSLFLVIVAFISLFKAYIVDGITFLLIGGTMFAICNLFTYYNMHIDASVDIIIGIALLVAAVMAFRAKDLLVLITDVAAGIMFFLDGIFFFNMDLTAVAIIAAVFAFIGGAMALYICVTDWMLVQDIADQYEQEMLGDDCCCCDDECQCEGECHCHDKE